MHCTKLLIVLFVIRLSHAFLTSVANASLSQTVKAVRNQKYLTTADGKSVLNGAIVPAREFYVNGNRPPGTLLLNMLIKNEAEHLARTLPKWANIIDAWIIGIDDNNTDSSADVIQQTLGHIPGALVTVHFDGMGPTWTQLVEFGVLHFPNITHGIISDADFAPLSTSFNKLELDVRCSKHLFNIFTADHTNKRKLDWIYRNIPGAKVQRRTHQSVHAPEMPEQDWYITQIDSLVLDERPGGYQDRTGAKTKAKKYIEFLEADLEEFGPLDTRSLYYLAVGYLDLFHAGVEEHGGVAREEDLLALRQSVSYYKRRAAIVGADQGQREERWFALLKLGEIYERYLPKEGNPIVYYTHAARLDPARSDAWYYAGQYLRLKGLPIKALPFLFNAAVLPMPDRALFHWNTMYDCISKVEYVRAALAVNINAENLHFEKIRIGSLTSNATISQLGLQSTQLLAPDEPLDAASRKTAVDDAHFASILANITKMYTAHISAAQEFAKAALEGCAKRGETKLLKELHDSMPALQRHAAKAREIRALLRKSDASTTKPPSMIENVVITPQPPAYSTTSRVASLRKEVVLLSAHLNGLCSAFHSIASSRDIITALAPSPQLAHVPSNELWCILAEQVAELAADEVITCRDVRLTLRAFRHAPPYHASAEDHRQQESTDDTSKEREDPQENVIASLLEAYEAARQAIHHTFALCA